MSYRVVFHPGAVREFDNLSRDAQERVKVAIDALSKDPRPEGSVKLTGEEAYRIRIGDYRVLYAIMDDKLIVLIVKVAHRRAVYKEMQVIKRRLKE